MTRTKVDHDHEFFAASARKYATTITTRTTRKVEAGDTRQPRAWIDVYMRRYRTLTGRCLIAGPVPTNRKATR